MHKKLENELVSLAHSILQMKNKEDIDALYKKAQALYEKLLLLKFVDTHFENTSISSESKEEIIFKIEDILAGEDTEKTVIPLDVNEEEMENQLSIEEDIEVDVEEEIEEEVEEDIEEEIEEIIEPEDVEIKDEEEKTPLRQTSLDEEFKDAISADVATQLFEKATKENPVVEQKTGNIKRSLNDTLFKNNIQVGLNDRIAFVKHLFDGRQEDFNRVVSQLNSFKTEKEAKKFLKKLVKPDYDWNGKEEYEQRLTDLIERKFL